MHFYVAFIALFWFWKYNKLNNFIDPSLNTAAQKYSFQKLCFKLFMCLVCVHAENPNAWVGEAKHYGNALFSLANEIQSIFASYKSIIIAVSEWQVKHSHGEKLACLKLR